MKDERVKDTIAELNKSLRGLDILRSKYIDTGLADDLTDGIRALNLSIKGLEDGDLGLDEDGNICKKELTAHWINLVDEYGDIHESVCSNCDANGHYKHKYCHNCGAKMVPKE